MWVDESIFKRWGSSNTISFRKVGVPKRTYFTHIPSPLIIFKKKSKGAGGSRCCTFDNMSIYEKANSNVLLVLMRSLSWRKIIICNLCGNLDLANFQGTKPPPLSVKTDRLRRWKFSRGQLMRGVPVLQKAAKVYCEFKYIHMHNGL